MSMRKVPEGRVVSVEFDVRSVTGKLRWLSQVTVSTMLGVWGWSLGIVLVWGTDVIA